MAYITTDINTDNATGLTTATAYTTHYTLYDPISEYTYDPYVPYYASGTDVRFNEDLINDLMDHVGSCLPADNDLCDESDMQDNVPSAELESFLENFKIIEDVEVA